MEKEKKEKEYLVTLDVFLMDRQSVVAKNRDEAIKKAIKQSTYDDGASEFTVFEVEEN